MAGFILSHCQFDRQALPFRIVELQGLGEILNCLLPLPLIEPGLSQVEVAIWIRRLQPDDRVEMPVRRVPLILLSGDYAEDHVAVHGIGGLGHLGVQYARQMGFETVALGRGRDKEALARKLGAHHYIDSGASDAAAELQKLGGARVILATAPNAKAISALVDGLSVDGKLLVPAAPAEPLSVSVLPLIMGRRSVAGWYSGTAMDSQETLKFSVLSGVHPMNEVFPLERVAEAYERMMSGKARFRIVLTTGH